MKFHFVRSADSSVKVACCRCSGVSDARKLVAAVAIEADARCADTTAPAARAAMSRAARTMRGDAKRVMNTSRRWIVPPARRRRERRFSALDRGQLQRTGRSPL
jgi:hypothetical protein